MSANGSEADAGPRTIPGRRALIGFLDDLRLAGWSIDTVQIADACRIRDLVASRASATLQEFAARVTPVIATDRKSQTDFVSLLTAWFDRPQADTAPAGTVTAPPPVQTMPPPVQSVPRPVETGPRRRRLPGLPADPGFRLILVVLCLLLAWGGSAAYRAYGPPEPEHRDHRLPPETVIPGPGPEMEPGFPRRWTETVESVRIEPGETEGPHPLARFLSFLPIILFLTWLGVRWARRFLWVGADSLPSETQLRRVAPGDTLTAPLFAAPDFRSAAQAFRRHRPLATTELDVERTVAATVARLGQVTPVFKLRAALPEYVFLIERKHRDDHLARLFDLAARTLSREGVLLRVFYYHTDPRYLATADGKGVLDLPELAATVPDHRLVVIGTGDGFFQTLTDRVQPWIGEFSDWASRAVLTTRPLREWTEQELTLLEEGFSLGTARRAGFESLSQYQSAGADVGGVLLEGLTVRRPPSVRPLPVKPPVDVLHGRWPQPGCIFRDFGSDGRPDPSLPEMVIIPSGTFTMGSPEDEPWRSEREGPQHTVTIVRPFALGRYAVTQAEWRALMGNNPSTFKGDRTPVENVSWNDVQGFIKALNKTLGLADGAGYRLPSEAEWEYACRAGTTTPFWWGSTITTDQANYDGDYTYNNGRKGTDRQKTVPVDEFEPNPFGLYQMHGNVWEWCQDCWNENYNGAPADGRAWTQGDCEMRVLRGGSWGVDPRSVRSAYRRRYAPAYRNVSLGFRLARTLSLES